MAKIKDPFGAREARGSVGAITSSRNTMGQYFRCKASPVQPRSNAQTTQRKTFQFLSKQFQKLTSDQIALWNDFAANWPVTDQFGDSITLTGFNWFIKLNSNLSLTPFDYISTPPLKPSLHEWTIQQTQHPVFWIHHDNFLLSITNYNQYHDCLFLQKNYYYDIGSGFDTFLLGYISIISPNTKKFITSYNPFLICQYLDAGEYPSGSFLLWDEWFQSKYINNNYYVKFKIFAIDNFGRRSNDYLFDWNVVSWNDLPPYPINIVI